MEHRSRAVLVLVSGLALSACRQDAAEAAAPAMPAAASATAEQATPAAANRQAPADRILLDFRGKWWDAPEIPGAEQQRIAKLLDPASTAEAQVTSRIDGAFTRAGAREQAVILVPEGASTIVPFPKPATLAILDGDRIVVRHAFDANAPSWQWIRAAADTDGDAIDELLLSSGYIQMGESATSLLVASMAGGRYQAGRTFDNVAYGNCDAHDDDRSKGRVEAAVIAIEGGKLVEHRYRAACPSQDVEGDHPEPAPGDYQPAQ